MEYYIGKLYNRTDTSKPVKTFIYNMSVQSIREDEIYDQDDHLEHFREGCFKKYLFKNPDLKEGDLTFEIVTMTFKDINKTYGSALALTYIEPPENHTMTYQNYKTWRIYDH